MSWVRTDPWVGSAVWADHVFVFEPWMRWPATTTTVSGPFPMTMTVAAPLATTTDVVIATATTTDVEIATATTSPAP